MNRMNDITKALSLIDSGPPIYEDLFNISLGEDIAERRETAREFLQTVLLPVKIQEIAQKAYAAGLAEPSEEGYIGKVPVIRADQLINQSAQMIAEAVQRGQNLPNISADEIDKYVNILVEQHIVKGPLIEDVEDVEDVFDPKSELKNVQRDLANVRKKTKERENKFKRPKSIKRRGTRIQNYR